MPAILEAVLFSFQAWVDHLVQRLFVPREADAADQAIFDDAALIGGNIGVRIVAQDFAETYLPQGLLFDGLEVNVFGIGMPDL